MKIKKEYIILFIIIMGLSLYLIFRSPDRTHYELPELSEIDKGEISKIEISQQDKSIILNKKDDKWKIGPDGYLANNNGVDNMLQTIEDLNVTALVSESKNYSRYDLDDDQKITIKAWSGEKLIREFEVGKAATSFRHTFVRLAGDDHVYHAESNFRDKFDQTVDDLRDKTVLSFDQSEIQEIEITQDKAVLAFSRTEVPVEASTGEEGESQSPPSQAVETAWKTADGKEGDEAQLDRLLRAASDLQCDQYINDKKKSDFGSPIYGLRFKGTEEYTLSIFAKTDEETKAYPAVSSGSEYPFLLPEWQVKSLMKKPEEMVKKPEKS